MTESKLVELGFSEVTPGFWVGSVFALNKLYELGRQDESGAKSAERETCALEVEKAGMEGYGTLAAAVAVRARGQQ